MAKRKTASSDGADLFGEKEKRVEIRQPIPRRIHAMLATVAKYEGTSMRKELVKILGESLEKYNATAVWKTVSLPLIIEKEKKRRAKGIHWISWNASEGKTKRCKRWNSA